MVQDLQQIGTPFLRTRHIVQDIGAHLEGCVKELHGVTQINQTVSPRTSLGFLPLGALAKGSPWVRKRLGNTLCRDIVQFCQLAWNHAKHEYRNNGSPDPMIPFADAVGCYFLARSLGAEVMQASGQLECVEETVMRERGRLGYDRWVAIPPRDS